MTMDFAIAIVIWLSKHIVFFREPLPADHQAAIQKGSKFRLSLVISTRHGRAYLLGPGYDF
jgi:hypothetical protein